MPIGLKGPNHLDNKGMTQSPHNVILVPDHIDATLLFDQLFIDNLQRTEAPIGQSPRKIDF